MAWMSDFQAEAVVHVGCRDSGSPLRSDSTCSLLPALPRSTGFGPVRSPLFGPSGQGV